MVEVSVIVPNYNHASYLARRIDSILSQTFQDFELIILDDCSTDNSREIIETYRSHPKITHVQYDSPNSGSPFVQWRKGIEMAAGRWIWIAESDDFAEPHFLEQALTAIRSIPETGLFYCDSRVVNEAGEEIEMNFSVRKNRNLQTDKWSLSYFAGGITEINESMKFDCTISNASSVLFRKQLATDHLASLSRFRYYGDWFLFLQICFSTNIYYCKEPLNNYRKHGESHLNRETFLAVSREEYFRILSLLYYHKKVSGKKNLVKYFTFQYLGFGILEDGPAMAMKILNQYFRMDNKLFLKVAAALFSIKVFRRKYKPT